MLLAVAYCRFWRLRCLTQRPKGFLLLVAWSWLTVGDACVWRAAFRYLELIKGLRVLGLDIVWVFICSFSTTRRLRGAVATGPTFPTGRGKGCNPIQFHWCTKCGRGCEFCNVILTLRGIFARLRPVRLRPFGPQVRSELEFYSIKWPATETFLQVLICGSRSINRAMAPFWISFTSLGSRGNYGHRRS